MLGFSLIGPLHALGVLALLLGIVLLIAWAVRTFSPTDLKTCGIWLVAGGLVLCVLTVLTGATMRHNAWEGKIDGRMMGRMEQMMQDDMMDDMTMDEMLMELDDLSGDDFDIAFLDMMIPHHEGAIEMAKAAKTSAKHPEIKAMADAIIATQQKEIDQMKQWMKEWGYE